MYSVWFCDLEKAIKALRKVQPNMDTFGSIEGNVYGDFVIKDFTTTYIVKHTDFSVWCLLGDWRNGKWVKIDENE